MTRGFQSPNPVISGNSYAVASQRHSPKKGAVDDFPTPPWAVRALFEYGLPESLKGDLAQQTVLEPCCGRGHMVKVLEEYFRRVRYSDKIDYGIRAHVRDFLTHDQGPVDWIVMNPPFSLAGQFVLKALEIATVGVAVFERIQFGEGLWRHKNLFLPHPPIRQVQFTGRVRIVEGRLENPDGRHKDGTRQGKRRGSGPQFYAWWIWRIDRRGTITRTVWIPDCRKELTRLGDYRQNPLAERGESRP